jgi:hypothetical protein
MNKKLLISSLLLLITSVLAAEPPVNKTGISGLTREETIKQRNWDSYKNNPSNQATRQLIRNESFKWTGDPTYFENNGTFDIKPHSKTDSN